MARTIWRKQITPAGVLISTAAATGCTLARTTAGYLRVAMPLQAAGDVGVAIPLGSIRDLYAGLPIMCRLRLHSGDTAQTYQIGVRFEALAEGGAGDSEAFNAAETLSELMTLPAANAVQDVEIEVEQGAAFDDAEDGDMVRALVTLKYDAVRVSSENLLVAEFDFWQEV